MAIHYVLRENKATEDPNDYFAVVVPTGIADEDEFLERMEGAGSTLKRPDMVAFMELAPQVLGAMIGEGFRINTRMGNYGAAIEGTFDGADAVFQTPQNQLNVVISQSPVLRKTVRTKPTQKDIAALPGPILVQFKNVADGGLNTVAQSGDIGEIKGDNLKFDPAASDEGIYFVPVSGAAVKVTSILNNFPKTLSFRIPTLTAQSYTLEVRKRFKPDSPFRTGDLPVQITGLAPSPPNNP